MSDRGPEHWGPTLTQLRASRLFRVSMTVSVLTYLLGEPAYSAGPLAWSRGVETLAEECTGSAWRPAVITTSPAICNKAFELAVDVPTGFGR